MADTLTPGATGVLVLADGTILQGIGVGAETSAVGEVCFNTAMTGYQEILTDPSYMAQIVAFTFPHIGNTGTNFEDVEQFGDGARTAARGAIFRDLPTEAANWRANSDFDVWLKRRGPPSTKRRKMKSMLVESSVTPNGLNGLVAWTVVPSSTGVMPAAGPIPNGSGAAWFFDVRRLRIALAEKLISSESSYLRLTNPPKRSSGI